MLGNGSQLNNENHATELLEELERGTPDVVKKLRAHTRLTIRANVIVEPGNQSERGTWRVQGVTGDISPGGMQILTPTPLKIGDIYLVSFDRTKLDLTPIFVRCLRGRLVRDDAFEAGLKFFNTIDLPVEAAAEQQPVSAV